MLNIKYGDKIIDSCITIKCSAYNTMIALSNNSDLKGVIKCPQIFCDRVKLLTHNCSICNKMQSIHDGYYEGKDFKCYQCSDIPEKKVEQKIEEKPLSEVNSDLVKQRLIEIGDYFNKLSKNPNFSKYYFDVKMNLVNFYNPVEMNNGIMSLTYANIEQTATPVLIETLEKFFKSFLDQFEDKNCSGCFYEQWTPGHMICIDCLRNKQSAATVRRDRYAGKK